MIWFLMLPLEIAFTLLALILAPVLPLFARDEYGFCDNANAMRTEPRLPSWLSWFMTPDNSLYGDAGWRTQHCPDHWHDYWGMVLWLWRNPACGFAWSVVAHDVDLAEVFSVVSSGCGLDLDKGRQQQGWFYVLSSFGAFHYRFVKEGGGVQWSFEAGWLLDVYVKDPQAVASKPRALFVFQPGIRRLKNG